MCRTRQAGTVRSEVRFREHERELTTHTLLERWYRQAEEAMNLLLWLFQLENPSDRPRRPDRLYVLFQSQWVL